MRALRLAVVALLTMTALAGCLRDDGDDDGDGGLPPATGIADGDPFFSSAKYDSGLFDPDVLSKPIYEILPVEEVYVEASDLQGTLLHNAVYRPDTSEPTPVWINFSPYWGDTAERRGDPFGTYMVENFVPRGYTVVLSAIRGTGHSQGCFEVSSDRELLDLREVIDYFAEQPWSNGNVGIGGKSYDSTPQNGMIAKFPTDNLKTTFHVSGITDWYEYQFHNGILARVDGGVFSTYYAASQGANEYGGLGDGDTNNEDADSIVRLVQDVICPEMAEHLLEPGTTTVHGTKTPYWQERDWTTTIGDTDWDGSIFFYHGLQDWNVQPAHILPWLENLPDHIDTKVWLHQNGLQNGHVYPMRTDWNLTMLRYLDQELKGIDTGFWDDRPNQVEGSDDIWRADPAWPLEGEITSLSLDGDVLLEATDDGYRYGGAPTITVTATPLNPDAVFTAILYDEDEAGERSWRNEAVLRLLHRDSLELPTPYAPGLPMTFTARFYAQDDVLEPGHKWVIEFQGDPAHSIPTPLQLQGLTVDSASVTVDMVLVDADANVLPDQPIPMGCITCP